MCSSSKSNLWTFMATSSLSVLATFASAQTNNSVKLQSADMSISGQLMGVVGNSYQIMTSSGELMVPIAGTTCEGASCPTPEISFEKGAEVTLKSPDGAINLTGQLDSVTSDHYVVNTTMGPLRVKSDRVECSGPGCPTIQSVAVENVSEKPVVPDEAKIRFAGSDTVGLGLLPHLMKDYATYLEADMASTDLSDTETYKRYVDASGAEITSIFANSTGSGDAFDALEVSGAEFGMTSRRAKDKEIVRMVASGAGDLRGTENETVIAVDSLAVITHPSNPVRDLDMSDIGDIYLGKITNWSQVGGPDAPITVLSREDGSSTRGVFEKAVFSGDEPPLADRVTYPGGDNPEMAEAVRSNPFAIGYVGFAYSKGLNRINLTSECGITSTANSFSVKTEEYPLGRRLYLYNRPDGLNDEAQKFLQYVLSPDADDAIAESSFINFAVERTAQPRSRVQVTDLTRPSELRLANEMSAELGNWDRLSTTVRFPTGSSTLGNKELNDIKRLISYLEELPAGTPVAIVGFADSVGPFSSNVQLSERRAQTVSETIRRMGGERLSGIQFENRSYGELAPSVCNTNENGRKINRRVELWVGASVGS
ncbi:MAG: phosphate ABC transporter substrate-binding/OmpA family protein [Paracoccaceae bacterium]